MYASKKILADFNLAVAKADRQTAKFNYPATWQCAYTYILVH